MMNMAKAGTEKAGAIRYGRVYASSVIQDYQDGKVYTLGNSAVIHHHCGFAFLIGNPTEEELSALYREMMRQDFGRFLLFCDEERIVDHFRDLPGVCIRGRYFFEYPLSDSKPAEVPQGYVLQEIDEELALMLKGRITLSFSWRNFDEFKKSGKGYCLTVNNKPVAWAFSAAVSDDEIDIYGCVFAPKIRQKLKRSDHPLVAFSIKSGEKISYMTSSAFEKLTEVYPDMLDADALIIGAHPPIVKKEINLRILSDDTKVFAANENIRSMIIGNISDVYVMEEDKCAVKISD